MAKIYSFDNFFKGECIVSKVTVYDIANAFLSFGSMTHKKLQKLCYYSQAWYLAFYDKKLFDNNFEAWVHGPVCPLLYEKYKSYGYTEIPQTEQLALNEDISEFIQNVFNTYGNFDGDQLEALTHMETPWKEARMGLEEWMPSHNIINDKTMHDFYLRVYESSTTAQA